MRNSKRNLSVLLLTAVLAMSCSSLTPKQTMLWSLNVYQAQYDLYLDQVLREDLDPQVRLEAYSNPSTITPEMVKTEFTDDMRKILVIKKQILTELSPLIKITNEALLNGEVPAKEVSDRMIHLLNLMVGGSE